MHIALMAHARHPLAEPFAGGLESMSWHLARALHERGHRVTAFAAPGSDPVPGVEVFDLAPLRLSPVAQADVTMPSLDFLQVHHAYLQAMLQLSRRDDVDVVHNNSLHYLPLAMSPATVAPTLTTLHTPPIAWLESAMALTDPGRTRFAAVSRHTAQAWRHVVQATVVPNGVDTDMWTRGPGGQELVWFGRIVPEKAPHLAVEAARLAGMPLVLAGPAADPVYFREVVRPLLGGPIRYAGHLGRADLSRLVGHSAAVLVTPEWDEPYGLVAAEALACGTPVAGFARGGLPEVIGIDHGTTRTGAHRKGGRVGALVAPGDTQALAEVIPAVLESSRSACRQHAVRHCSLPVMVDRYLELYASTAAMSSAA